MEGQKEKNIGRYWKTPNELMTLALFPQIVHRKGSQGTGVGFDFFFFFFCERTLKIVLPLSHSTFLSLV